MTAVSVKELTFSYDGKRNVIDGVSFSVEKGEIFVIAGLSGCGKTTLCHIIAGLIPKLIDGRLEGEVLVDGEPVRSVAENAKHIGLVFQDSDAQIIATTVEDELAFGPENFCVPPDEIRRRVDETAKRLGLYDRLTDDPASLSGGKKKLLCIGSVLILDPETVILDEPMVSLDAEGRELVRREILSLRENGKTVIVVEHDLTLADYADRWMILGNGKIALLDSRERIMSNTDELKRLEMWFD